MAEGKKIPTNQVQSLYTPTTPLTPIQQRLDELQTSAGAGGSSGETPKNEPPTKPIVWKKAPANPASNTDPFKKKKGRK